MILQLVLCLCICGEKKRLFVVSQGAMQNLLLNWGMCTCRGMWCWGNMKKPVPNSNSPITVSNWRFKNNLRKPVTWLKLHSGVPSSVQKNNNTAKIVLQFESKHNITSDSLTVWRRELPFGNCCLKWCHSSQLQSRPNIMRPAWHPTQRFTKKFNLGTECKDCA